jgi:ABC transporter, phosphonate, periplasmic substrate-binding protein
MKQKSIAAILFGGLALGLPVALLGEETTFIIVQPGYPGSTTEASSFVADLSRAISAGGGPKDLRGEYHNSVDDALKAIAASHPAFGVVSLGFYLSHKGDLKLEALLESQPPEPLYLARKKGEDVTLSNLAGKTVVGTPFQEPEFIARVVFGPGAGGGPPPAGAGPEKKAEGRKGAAAGPGATGQPAADAQKWKIEPSQSFSKAVRDVARGKAQAVLLTKREKTNMEELTAGKELEVFWQSEPLPISIVVAFENGGRAAQPAAKALADLKQNAQGKDLLSTMGIEGFGPNDRTRMSSFESRFHAAGSSPSPDPNAPKAGGR